jgi:hypothetical protein
MIKEESNPVALMIKQKLKIPEGDEAVFSFMDVSSFWKDPHMHQKLKGVTILQERHKHLKEMLKEEKNASQSADSFVDWSESSEKENPEEAELKR